jgi:hypothetical protein
MTPAQLAAMCAKLNCAPTAAALTTALLSLPGSGTSGNVLTIVGGVPVWQASVAGAAATVPAAGIQSGALPSGVTIGASQVTNLCPAVQTCLSTATISADNITGVIPSANLPQNDGNATSVPATGIQSGALPSGVTTTPSSVVGFSASALAAIPLSTNAVVGKSRSANPIETGAGILDDGVHVSPADLIGAMRMPTALSAAIAINPNKYGTFASVLAPTAPPTEANPQTILTNSNGEVFAWGGAKWVLIADGLRTQTNGAITDAPPNGLYIYATYTAPRAGRLQVITAASGQFNNPSTSLNLVAIDSFGIGSEAEVASVNRGLWVVNSSIIDVVAGQVVSAGIGTTTSAGVLLSGSGKLVTTYIG